jgi:small subunit ribosomal protein S20
MDLKKRNKNEKSEKKSQRNKKYTTSIKNHLKMIRLKRTSDLPSLKKEFVELQSKLDKAVVKGIIHLNKANRLKHRLSKRINDKEINSVK